MTDEFDSEKFKILDAASYDSLIEKFDQFTERLSQPLARHLIELAKISENDCLLDVGTGTGVVALQAARRAKNVCGVDLSAEMLTTAAAKARGENLKSRVVFCRMDAENLGLENQTFDVIVSLFALLHFPHPTTALREIFRVLRPGGRTVIAVGSGIPIFSPFGWIHLFKRFPDILRTLRHKQLIAPDFLDDFVKQHISETIEPDESDLASRHRNRASSVRSLIKEAGFEVLRTDWRGHREVIETPEEFWEIQRTFSSIARKRLKNVTAEKLESLQMTFLKECRAVQERGGQLVYPFGAFYVVARRPNF